MRERVNPGRGRGPSAVAPPQREGRGGRQSSYTVTVSLLDRFDEPLGIIEEIGVRLGPFEVVAIDTDPASTRIVFTIDAVDLWQAVLHALGLVRSIGCSPISLAADLAA